MSLTSVLIEYRATLTAAIALAARRSASCETPPSSIYLPGLAELFTEPLPKAKNGVVVLPKGPGLGLDLDKKKLERYRLR